MRAAEDVAGWWRRRQAGRGGDDTLAAACVANMPAGGRAQSGAALPGFDAATWRRYISTA